MKPSPLRRALNDGTPALGIFVMMDAGLGASLLANVGYDFLIFDLQHAPLDLQRVDAILSGTIGTECAPLARVRPNRPDEIEWILDMGAHGVVVPLVNSAQDAAVAVAACRYPPIGRRSVGAVRNLLRRGESYATGADADVLCIIQIEHIDAVNNIDEILDVPGVDAVLPGHVDLAMSMGVSMNYGASISNTVPEQVAQAIERVESACAARNIPVIPVVGNPAEFGQALTRGERIVCCNTDYHMLKAAAVSQLAGYRAQLAEAAAAELPR